MREVRENILVAHNTVPASGLFLYDRVGDGNASLGVPFKLGDIVFYDPRNNITVGAGVTAQQVPKLGIAQVVKGREGGLRLRTAFGGYVDANTLKNVTTEPPRCGCNNVIDMYTNCTYKDTDYSVTIGVRGDRELDYNLWNQWTEDTQTVNLKDFACDSCDTGLNQKDLWCAIANKFNAHTKNYKAKHGGVFLKQALSQQAKSRGYEVFPIFGIDKHYTFALSDEAGNTCSSCTLTQGFNKLVIDPLGEAIEVDLSSLVDATDTTKMPMSNRDRLVYLINKGFKDAGKDGSAVILESLTGSGRSCCSFSMWINSCAEFDLYNNAVEPAVITPDNEGATNPFSAISDTAHCVGCGSSAATFTPTGGLRIVAKAHEVTCDPTDPVDRTTWYHRQVRVSEPKSGSYWTPFIVKEVQAVQIPENLGVQWAKRILDMDNGGTGGDYEPWVVDNGGLYNTPNKTGAWTNAIQGLDCKKSYCSTIFRHNLNYQEKSINGSYNGAKGSTVLLIDNDNSNLYNDIKAVLDPWLASISHATFGPIVCNADVDQIESVVNPDTNVVTSNAQTPAVAATGVLTLTGNALEGETVTIGTQVYTFTATVDTPNEVLIGANASASIDNLISAITGGAGAGTNYGAGTVINTKVTAAAGAGDTMDVTAKVAGSAGNSIATTETLTNGSFGAATLTGGTDAGNDLGN